MKKAWRTPTLEILNINQTMYGEGGDHEDTVAWKGRVLETNDNVAYSGVYTPCQVGG